MSTYQKYIDLFKGLPVKHPTNNFSEKYLKYGVLVEESIVKEYAPQALTPLVKNLVPKNSELNKSFHKSWKKVQEAPIEQLVLEQLLHYMSTYGAQQLGIYSDDTIFIPFEELELDEEGGITFVVLKGLTKEDMAEKINKLVSSGIALSVNDLGNLIEVVKVQEKD